MELFDSHAHYDDERFKNDAQEAIQAAYDSGVRYILNAASDIPTSKKSIEFSERFDFVFASVGVHPHEVKDLKDENIEKLCKLCSHKKVVAIGEIGLDYYYDNSPRELQKYWFAKQLDLARELKMPVIIHDRDAHEDIMRIITSKLPFEASGVFHCFSGSWDMAKKLLDNGFYISIGGPITFKNAKKAVEVVKNIPMDRLLIETDCPYLTPEPFRGKRNESKYVRLAAEKIAEIRGATLEEIATATTENAKRLFRI